MTVLNNVIHFRGEVVTLYGTFKIATGESVVNNIDTDEEQVNENQKTVVGFLDPISPKVKVEYVNAINEVITILQPTAMKRITDERWFYNWTIPMNAPLTTYNVVTSGIVDGKVVQSTEELVVGNPSITAKGRYLKYGRNSFLQTSRTYEPRLSPQLPKGMF